MSKKAIILGSSGLIGGLLLDLLTHDANYSEIIVFNRKPLLNIHKKVKEIIVDFVDLNSVQIPENIDVIFCCLGSTKSKTPNLIDYKKVDFDIPLYFAKKGKELGVKQYHLVSALGANSTSSNFYSKLKGDIEEAIKKIEIEGTFIYQPSILLGKRLETRILERIGIIFMRLLNPILIGNLKKYRAIEAQNVAKVMQHISNQNLSGLYTYTSDKINELA